MECDDRALDGLLRELARAPQGDDDAFVARVLAGARPQPMSLRPLIVAAAVFLLGLGALFAFPPKPATGRVEFRRAACLVPDATHLRLLTKDRDTGRLLLLGQVPIDSEVRVPAGTPVLLQAIGADGLARWTSPDWVRVRPSPASPAPVLHPRSGRSVEFARDVKPILDQHCSGCHAESDLARAGAKPFEARRSPIVIQTHGLLSDSERLQLALWVDLGASGRP